jgi:hypothetical protein
MSFNKLSVWIVAFLLSFAAGSASALSTTIEVVNNTTSNASLTSASYTGIITPALPNPLPAMSNSIHVSTSSGLADAGTFYYAGCRFNWSVINQGGYYSFSIGAQPSSRCSSNILVQNVFTGEYSIQFFVDL